MKKIFSVLLAAVLLLGLCACGDVTISSSMDAPDSEKSAAILLEGDKISKKGGGVSVSGTVATISAAGDYTVSGVSSNAQIVVNTGDDAGRVRIVLDNAELSNPNGPTILVQQAKDLRIFLNPGSENILRSGVEGQAVSEDEASGAVIFSEDDIDLEGEGSLKIYGYINNGITGKDDVDINSGTISVYAVNNGIKGSESVDIKGGVISVEAGNDGIKASSAAKAGKGYVHISAGELSVLSAGDGISAESELTIDGGTISVVTRGDAELASCKALKAKTALTVNGGSLTLSSADHAIHCTAGLSISGGELVIVSEKAKGMAAHGDMALSGGSVSIIAGDDGIETEGCLSISGGSFAISSGANGIKTGFDGTGFETDNGLISITGGELIISAFGDAIDAKGAVTVDGGSIFALGLSKSLKGFDAASAQPFIALSLSGSAGSTVSIEPIMGMAAEWNYNTVLYSSPELVSGSEYRVTNGINSLTAIA